MLVSPRKRLKLAHTPPGHHLPAPQQPSPPALQPPLSHSPPFAPSAAPPNPSPGLAPSEYWPFHSGFASEPNFPSELRLGFDFRVGLFPASQYPTSVSFSKDAVTSFSPSVVDLGHFSDNVGRPDPSQLNRGPPYQSVPTWTDGYQVSLPHLATGRSPLHVAVPPTRNVGRESNSAAEGLAVVLPPGRPVLSLDDPSCRLNSHLPPSYALPLRNPGKTRTLGVKRPHASVIGNDILVEPVLPRKEKLKAFLGVMNPFLDNAKDRIRQLGPPPPVHNLEVNGYIKFRLRSPRSTDQPQTPGHSPGATESSAPSRTVVTSVGLQALQSSPPSSSSSQSLIVSKFSKSSKARRSTAAMMPEDAVERPLPSFGWQSKLNKMERYLVDFYITAWCAGRTILPSTNCWIQDITQIADSNACVRHAMLALSSTYVLDYKPDEKIRQASNAHYERAVTLLTDALKDERELRPGGSVSTVAAIALLDMLDVVSPEHRRSRDQIPRWLEGARMACRLLDATDPGHRYWNAENIQTSQAWVANTIISSRAAIVALPMMPLDPANTGDRQFQWLLSHGNERETRKIHGACGFSPRLLHRIAQVTHLAALLQDDPDSVTIREVAAAVSKELHSLRQWSELNPQGYDSTDALLAHCDKRLDPSGVVADRASMTDLTAEAWRLAAIIYSLCRLYRLPRSHDKVLFYMAKLAACIRRTPTSGSLFTAQAPFFPVFLLGLLAVKEDHVQSAMQWFDSVLQTYCRSSVPPAYEALKRARKWLLSNVDDSATDDLPAHAGHRYAWWETLVAEVTRNEGILCLI